MITLTDFQKHEASENKLKLFLAEKCNEYNAAKAFDIEDYYIDEETESNLDCWELHGLNIIIWFTGKDRDTEFYTYELPLDILFDVDFKDKMKARFEDEREKQRLALIEKRKRHEVELRALAEKKKKEEIEQLKELLKKYPDVAINNEGVGTITGTLACGSYESDTRLPLTDGYSAGKYGGGKLILIEKTKKLE